MLRALFGVLESVISAGLATSTPALDLAASCSSLRLRIAFIRSVAGVPGIVLDFRAWQLVSSCWEVRVLEGDSTVIVGEGPSEQSSMGVGIRCVELDGTFDLVNVSIQLVCTEIDRVEMKVLAHCSTCQKVGSAQSSKTKSSSQLRGSQGDLLVAPILGADKRGDE